MSSNREQPAVVCGAHAINQIQLLFLLTGSILESVSKKKKKCDTGAQLFTLLS